MEENKREVPGWDNPPKIEHVILEKTDQETVFNSDSKRLDEINTNLRDIKRYLLEIIKELRELKKDS
jgi:hypothetical protein